MSKVKPVQGMVEQESRTEDNEDWYLDVPCVEPFLYFSFTQGKSYSHEILSYVTQHRQK